MAGRCGLEDYARRCVRCRVPKHADSSSAAELDARLSLSLPVPNEVTLRARAREERCAHVMHQRFPVVNSCQRPQIVAALPLSTLRLTRMEIESTKSENRQRHAVIKKYQDFFFSLSRILRRKALFGGRTFRKPPIVASLFERSARHPPAHTMQIFVKTRAYILRLSIENSV